MGGDGDGLDVFIGPDSKADEAFWAIQKKPDGSFDEYKVFLGFSNRDAAIAAYREHIPKKLLAGMVTMKTDMMKAMLKVQPEHTMKKLAMIVSCRHELDKIAESFTDYIPPEYVDPQIARALAHAPTRKGLRELFSAAADKIMSRGKEEVEKVKQ